MERGNFPLMAGEEGWNPGTFGFRIPSYWKTFAEPLIDPGGRQLHRDYSPVSFALTRVEDKKQQGYELQFLDPFRIIAAARTHGATIATIHFVHQVTAGRPFPT